MQRRWRMLAGVLGSSALTAGLLGLSPPGASAQVAPEANSTATIVHAIQGVTVDLYADGNLISDADGVAPGESLGPVAAAPGTYVLSVYEHTTDPPPDLAPGTGALITQTETVGPEASNFSLAAGFTATGTPTLLRFTNDVSLVPAGSGRVSVRHAANAGPVDVYADGALVIPGLANGEAFDLVLPAGTTSIEVFAEGADPSGTPLIGPEDVTVADGSFTEVYASTGLPTATDAPALVTVTRPIPSPVKFVHGIPGAGAVDVYDTTDGGPLPLVEGLTEEATSEPVPLAGTRTIAVFAAGADPATATALFAGDLDFPANAYSSAAIGLDAADTPTVTVFTNDLSSTGPALARVAFRHIAGLGDAAICLEGEEIPIANGEEVLDLVGAGTYSIGIIAAGGDCAAPAIGPVSVTVEAGTFYEAYVIGDDGPPSTLDLLILSTPTEQLFNPVTPTRIADTRDGSGGVGTARLLPGEVLTVNPGANSDVPAAGVAAVALNVTAAEPSADGYLRVFPCNDAEPDISNVNYTAGEIAEPNAVVVGVDPVAGGVCITTFAETDVIVDVFGWFADDSGLGAVTPERIADTRNPSSPNFGQLVPGAILTIDVTDDPLVDAAVLNVTAANTTERGYLTVFPCDDTVPYASNVNYEAEEAGSPNAVLTGLDAEGQVCISTYAPVDVIVDLFGTFEEGSPFVGLTPERLADTRDGVGGVPVGKVQPGTPLVVQVADADDAVNGATLNVTATEADANGYLTVYPCDEPQPYASNVNYTTEELSAPNAVVTGLSETGTVCISAYAPVHVVVDLTGVFED